MRPEDVPPGPLLVDTDAFSWITWQRGLAAEFARLIEGHVVALSFASVGELRAGALVNEWGEKRRQALEDRIAQYIVLEATDAVTRRFAENLCPVPGSAQGRRHQRHVDRRDGTRPAHTASDRHG